MVLEISCCLFLLFACVPVMAGEKAAYDSNGRIVSMLSDAGEVKIASSIVAVLPGKPVPLQVRREDSGAVRQGRNLAWSAAFSLPRRRARPSEMRIRRRGDVAEWLGLPLLVTEMGVDASAYYTRSYDSYEHGLREARMAQELLSYARPQGAQFWQFTDDYSLARVAGDGTVVPTARFWLMKHFTDLTPPTSDALTTASDQPAVLVTAFRNHRDYTVNILNLGGFR